MKRLIILILLLPLNAQALGLDDYIELGLRENPGLLAASSQWQASREAARTAGLPPDPQIAYTHFIEEVETRVGPQEYKLGLRQPLPWAGRLLKQRDIAQGRARQAELNYELAAAQLILQLSQLYYALYLSAYEIDNLSQQLQLLEQSLKVSEKRYAAASAGHAELLELRMQQARLAERRLKLGDLLASQQALFNSLLNRAPQLEIDLPHSLPAPSELPPTALLLQLRDNPQLSLSRNASSIAREQERLSRLNRVPDFTLGVEYIETGAALNPTTKDSGKDPLMASIAVNLPLWGSQAERAQSQASHQASLAQSLTLMRQLEARVLTAVNSYREARRRFSLYDGELLPLADQLYQVRLKDFESARSSYAAVLKARQQLLELQFMRETALTDCAKLRAELAFLAPEEKND